MYCDIQYTYKFAKIFKKRDIILFKKLKVLYLTELNF